jgi:hypothetical protein
LRRRAPGRRRTSREAGTKNPVRAPGAVCSRSTTSWRSALHRRTLKTMRAEGINIVAIHQHMTEETPRYVFLHYWGKGNAVDLAKAVKKALNTQRL